MRDWLFAKPKDWAQNRRIGKSRLPAQTPPIAKLHSVRHRARTQLFLLAFVSHAPLWCGVTSKVNEDASQAHSACGGAQFRAPPNQEKDNMPTSLITESSATDQPTYRIRSVELGEMCATWLGQRLREKPSVAQLNDLVQDIIDVARDHDIEAGSDFHY